MAVLDSLFVELGFEIDSKELDKFKNSMQEAKDSVVSITKVLGVASAAIGLFVFKVAGGLDDLGDFTELNQVTAESVQELGHAAQLNGSSLDAVKSSIEGLNRVTGEAINGLGRGKKSFEKFGLSAKNQDGSIKSFDDLLGEIAVKMQGMDRKAAISMAGKLGLDKSLVPLLVKGKDALEEYRQEARDLGITTSEQVAEASKFQDEYDRLKFTFLATSRSLALGLMPQIREAITSTRKWFVENRKLINSTIGVWLKVISNLLGTAWDWLGRIVDMLKPVVKWLFNSKIGVALLAGALGVLINLQAYKTIGQLVSAFRFLASILTITNVAALITTALIGLLIAGVALLIDDFINFKEGNDSLIGDLVKEFPQLLNVINAVESGVSSFISFWMEQWVKLKEPLGELFSNIWQLVSLLATNLWPIIKMVFQGWGLILGAVLPIFINLLSGIIAGFVTLISWALKAFNFIAYGWKLLFNGFASVIDFALSPLMNFIGWLSKGLDLAKRLLGIGSGKNDFNITQKSVQSLNNSAPNPLSSSGLLGGVSNSNTSNIQTTQITGTTIQINSPDPTKAGQSVKKELDRMNKSATRNGQSQVAL